MISKAEISRIKSLDRKKGRTEHSLFLVEGEKLAQELLDSRYAVRELYHTAACPPELLRDAGRREVRVVPVSAGEMERISLLKTPSSVLALVGIPENGPSETMRPDSLVLALDGVQDPGNLGTIIRIADWFGIREILCSPGTADVYNPKVVQATMGALTRVGVRYVDLPETLAGFRKAGIPVAGTFLDGRDITGVRLPKRGVIVMGNEGNGISEEVEKLVDHKLFIPSFPGGESTSESLNVSVATAIICYASRFGQ